MSISKADLPKNTSTSGKMTADLNELGKFEGEAFKFETDKKHVIFMGKHPISPTEWNYMSLTFQIDIVNGRHFFNSNSEAAPPLFSEISNNGNSGKPYPAKPDEGYVDITFDKENGTLEAAFNYTFKHNSRQVVGNIVNGQGMEYVKKLPEIGKSRLKLQ